MFYLAPSESSVRNVHTLQFEDVFSGARVSLLFLHLPVVNEGLFQLKTLTTMAFFKLLNLTIKVFVSYKAVL